MDDTLKNGGAASPNCSGKEGTDAEIELSRKTKKVSPFCEDCRPAVWCWQGGSFRVFVDRDGLAWHCFKMFTCEHAVIMGGKIHSCKVRTAQLNQEAAAK